MITAKQHSCYDCIHCTETSECIIPQMGGIAYCTFPKEDDRTMSIIGTFCNQQIKCICERNTTGLGDCGPYAKNFIARDRL